VSTKIFTGPDYSLITVAMVHVYLQRCAYSSANKDLQLRSIDLLNVPHPTSPGFWLSKPHTIRCHHSHPVQICDSNHTHSLMSFNSHSTQPMNAHSDQEKKRLIGRNGCPKDIAEAKSRVA